MYQAGDIVRCDHCGNYAELESDDLELAIGSHGTLIYIECPYCHNMLTIEGIL